MLAFVHRADTHQSADRCVSALCILLGSSGTRSELRPMRVYVMGGALCANKTWLSLGHQFLGRWLLYTAIFLYRTSRVGTTRRHSTKWINFRSTAADLIHLFLLFLLLTPAALSAQTFAARFADKTLKSLKTPCSIQKRGLQKSVSAVLRQLTE